MLHTVELVSDSFPRSCVGMHTESEGNEVYGNESVLSETLREW